MSVSIVDVISIAQYLAAVVLAVVGLYRALEIRRFFVSPVYRGRVNWTIGLMIALLFLLLSAGYLNIPYITWEGGTLGIFVMVFALILFVDSNIKVAMESDFFHRDILHWRAIGTPIVVMTLGYGLLGLLLIALVPSIANSAANAPVWASVGVLLFFVLIGVDFCIGAAGLIIGARRSQDTNMKKFVRMVGLSVACLALFFTIWIPLSLVSVDLGNIVSQLFTPLSAYFIYRAVLSLSPIGRVEKVV